MTWVNEQREKFGLAAEKRRARKGQPRGEDCPCAARARAAGRPRARSSLRTPRSLAGEIPPARHAARAAPAAAPPPWPHRAPAAEPSTRRTSTASDPPTGPQRSARPAWRPPRCPAPRSGVSSGCARVHRAARRQSREDRDCVRGLPQVRAGFGSPPTPASPRALPQRLRNLRRARRRRAARAARFDGSTGRSTSSLPRTSPRFRRSTAAACSGRAPSPA